MLDWRSYERTGLPALQYALVGVAVFLPWRSFFSYFFIGAAAALWLLFFRRNKQFLQRETVFFLVLLCSVYAVEVMGMIYTENVAYGFHRLESKLSLVVFPLVILVSGIGRQNTEKIVWFFVASTVIACLVCTAVVFWKLATLGQPISALFTDAQYSYIYLTEPLRSLHPTYLSLFICLSVFVLAEEVRRQRRRYWLLTVAVFLLLFGIQLASRAGYAALLCTLILAGYSAIGWRRKMLLTAYSIAIVASIGIAVSIIPQVKERMVDSVLEADIDEEQLNSVNFHLKSWTCAIESWLNGNVIFGYGTGDEVLTLENCHEQRGWIGNRHDAHNEFLSSLVKHGLIGLITMLGFFFYPFFLALKYRDVRYVVFLTTALICFMSESMLRGLNSLVYFALFNTLFLNDLLIARTQTAKKDTLQ